MSTAIEIEKAILDLPSDEVEKLATWWESFRTNKHEAKKKAIMATAGYLTKDDEDFVTAVEEAGKDVPDPSKHEW